MSVEPCALVFCHHCGSERVDVRGWREGSAIFACADCDNEQIVPGFTVGRVALPEAALEEARDDRAFDEVTMHRETLQ